MSQQRTDKCKYPSKYSPGGWVTPAQYISEIVCENKAAASGISLPIKFWELDEWSKYYRGQIPSANKLLKKYRAESIVKALRTWKGKKIHSLRAPWLVDLIKEEEKVADQTKSDVILEKVVENPTRRQEKPKGGLLDKLRALDE